MVLQRRPAIARLRGEREVKEEQQRPGDRCGQTAVTEVPQRDTGHGGRLSIALHYAAQKEDLIQDD